MLCSECGKEMVCIACGAEDGIRYWDYECPECGNYDVKDDIVWYE